MQLVLFLLVVPAALFDLKERRVPNWITLPGVLVAIALNAFLYETPGLWLALKGMGLAMLVYLPLYMLRGMGAGDVKLMAAVGAAAGWANWIGIMFLTALFGGISALFLVLWRRQLHSTMKNIQFIIRSLLHRQAPHMADPALDVKSDKAIRLPHAIAIAFGTLGYLLAAAVWAPR
jgi:prepilin peptidase CpaA